MGAFERLQAYNSALGQGQTAGASKQTSSVGTVTPPNNVGSGNTDSSTPSVTGDAVAKFFDVTQPLGYFLRTLHNMGFMIVDNFYVKGDTALTESEYNRLEASEQQGFVYQLALTEFAKMLLADGDVLALSSAGSGKTTALTFKIMKDIITGEATKLMTVPGGNNVNVVDSIFIGTFLKSGADELKQTLEYWQRKLGYFVTVDRMNFGTLHAEFKRVLTAMGVETPIAKQADLRRYLRKAIDRLGIQRDDGSPLTFDDYTAIESILAYYRNRLDNERYNHPACADYSLTPTILDAFYAKFQEQKAADKVMDFEDLQELLYQYLYVTPNPAVQDFVANRYNYIYLDEFQDTSQIQYAILKFYARGRLAINKDPQYAQSLKTAGTFNYVDALVSVEGGGKMVCIGDDDQAIYSWRGSDVNIITKDFIHDFKPSIVNLSTNYRCPENVLMPIIPSIVRNQSRYDKPLRSAKTGGEFGVYEFPDLAQMANYLVDEVAKDVMAGRTVGIVCRTNFDGMIPALMLERMHKFMFSITSDSMTLNSAMAKSMMKAASIFTERTTPAVKDTLASLVPYWAKFKVETLMKTLKNDDNVRKRASVWTVDERDLHYSCPEIYQQIMDMKSLMYNPDGTKRDGGEINALKYLYIYLQNKVYCKDNPYCSKMRAYISLLISILDSGEFNTVHDFLNELDEINDRLQARIKKANQQISIVTVHEFKGKERDVIYVWNDSVGVFPTVKTDIQNLNELEEERRVHYIACTRARQKSVILTLKGRHGIFLDEMPVNVVDKSPSIATSLKNAQTNNGVPSCDEGKDAKAVASAVMEKLVNTVFDDSMPSV